MMNGLLVLGGGLLVIGLAQLGKWLAIRAHFQRHPPKSEFEIIDYESHVVFRGWLASIFAGLGALMMTVGGIIALV